MSRSRTTHSGHGLTEKQDLGRAGPVNPGRDDDGLECSGHPAAVALVPVGMPGHLRPGQVFQLRAQRGLVALDGEHAAGAVLDEPARSVPWQCRASAVITAPGRSMAPRSSLIAGISLPLSGTARCATTMPAS